MKFTGSLPGVRFDVAATRGAWTKPPSKRFAVRCRNS